FVVSLSPIWRTWPAAPQAASAEIKRQVEQSAERIKPQAVEKELTIQEVKGASGAGYYFSATDAAPKPGEFKHILQGMIRVGEFQVVFTVLTQDGSESIRRQSIALVQSAAHTNEDASSSPGTNTGRPDAIQITQTNTHYVLSVPASRLVMQLPNDRLLPTK